MFASQRAINAYSNVAIETGVQAADPHKLILMLYEGAMLALVVELLATAITGAAMGFEASSFFVDEGNRPRLGQAFLVIDPDALAGRAIFLDRIETLVTEMTNEPGVRLPGARRRALAEAAEARGVEIAPALLTELQRLAG